ncbi:MAG: ROK family protein [Candidatus Omnitrophica bacterium]|nr:ROK family protein [Candidatus Omnitrophota bacterium]MDD5592003.1 ROK family protein [Candidatus Omnitrophota bacterium]
MAKRFIAAIDLGGTNLKIALLDLKFRIRHKEVLDTQRFSKKEALISAIVHSVDKILKDNKLNRANLLGVGLGLPGPIDFEKGIVHFFPNIPGWKEVKLKIILQNKLRLPVFVDNDAKAMCLAEYKLGAARGATNAVCLTLGTGIGGSIIINGKLYRGLSNAAGEIGHLPINENGPRCNCGGRACLESYIGNNRVLEEARKIFSSSITLEELSSLARKGNPKAKAIWRQFAERLSVALTGIINILNPDCIVIGGGVANAGRVLFDNLKKITLKRAMSVQARRVNIFKAKLGADAGLIGAAILVKEGIRQ